MTTQTTAPSGLWHLSWLLSAQGEDSSGFLMWPNPATSALGLLAELQPPMSASLVGTQHDTGRLKAGLGPWATWKGAQQVRRAVVMSVQAVCVCRGRRPHPASQDRY